LKRCSSTSAYMAGMTITVKTVAVTIPPTIGAAIRFITSDPVPCPARMGSNPPMVDMTVIMMGRILPEMPSVTTARMSRLL